MSRSHARSPEGLGQVLGRCAAEVEKDPRRSSALRDAKEEVDHWLMTETPNGASVRLFMLSTLLDHLLTVLTGDVVYEVESGRVRDGIMLKLAPVLRAAADSLGHFADAPESTAFPDAYGVAVSRYLIEIRRVNSLLERHL